VCVFALEIDLAVADSSARIRRCDLHKAGPLKKNKD